jgi:hypothetical protein
MEKAMEWNGMDMQWNGMEAAMESDETEPPLGKTKNGI